MFSNVDPSLSARIGELKALFVSGDVAKCIHVHRLGLGEYRHYTSNGPSERQNRDVVEDSDFNTLFIGVVTMF